LINIGVGAVLLFFVIRFANFYGDPGLWSKQDNFLNTFLDFISTTKYPPSLLYALMTLGPSILFLAFTERANNPLSKFISIYGRVPMFYYILHIYLLHAAAMIAAGLFTNFSWQVWILKEPLWLTQTLKGYGFPLSIVYIVWTGVILILYPLCKWYDRYKQKHKEKWWLSYL
jgi:Predicted membrane protein